MTSVGSQREYHTPQKHLISPGRAGRWGRRRRRRGMRLDNQSLHGRKYLDNCLAGCLNTIGTCYGVNIVTVTPPQVESLLILPQLLSTGMQCRRGFSDRANVCSGVPLSNLQVDSLSLQSPQPFFSRLRALNQQAPLDARYLPDHHLGEASRERSPEEQSSLSLELALRASLSMTEVTMSLQSTLENWRKTGNVHHTIENDKPSLQRVRQVGTEK